MPAAELNLAAFGVVFAIALVAESPIIQMLSAATALSGNRQNYRLLMRFMHLMALGLTGTHLLIGLTPAYDLIVGGILQVPEHVTEASRWPFVVMAPFPAGVGYRRLWQGVLIRHGKTWVVPVSMVSRIIVLAVVLALGYYRWHVSGAMLAAIAIAVGATVAAVVAGFLNRLVAVPIMHDAREDEEVLGWHSLLSFYVPLSLTTVVFLLARPVMTFGIARAALPERSLAVWPVLNAYLFIFNSLALSHQETAIALLKEHPESAGRLRVFTALLAIGLSGLMLLSALTPAGTWWFRNVSGLSPQLLELTGVPLLILAIVPALVTYKAWYRAHYVGSGKTGILAEGVVVYTLGLFILVFAGSSLTAVAGVITAALAMTLSQGMENGYLLLRGRRARIASGTG
jgi:progressive ankylosis protein